MAPFLLGMTTTGKEEDAVRLAKELVERRLVACANVLPKIRSFYHWKNKLCDDSEWLIFMKTKEEKVELIKTALKELHSYEEPELIFIPISSGSETYLKWISDSLSS